MKIEYLKQGLEEEIAKLQKGGDGSYDTSYSSYLINNAHELRENIQACKFMELQKGITLENTPAYQDLVKAAEKVFELMT